jgi:hypothetical protein
MITHSRQAAADPPVKKTMLDRTAGALRGRNETSRPTATRRATVGMTGSQKETGISETVFPAGHFVWKMRTHSALAMNTGNALAKISLSHRRGLTPPHRRGLTPPHRTAAAQIAAVQETAVVARGRGPGKMRKSSMTRNCHSLMHPATREACRAVEAPYGTEGMQGRTMTSARARLPAVAGRKSGGRIMAVTRETGAHGMTNQPGSTTERTAPGYQHGSEIKRLPRTGRTPIDLPGVAGLVGISKTGGDPAAVVLPPAAWQRQVTNWH